MTTGGFMIAMGMILMTVAPLAGLIWIILGAFLMTQGQD